LGSAILPSIEQLKNKWIFIEIVLLFFPTKNPPTRMRIGGCWLQFKKVQGYHVAHTTY